MREERGRREGGREGRRRREGGREEGRRRKKGGEKLRKKEVRRRREWRETICKRDSEEQN